MTIGKLRFYLFLTLSLFTYQLQGQTIKYSPSWFGPNANPVPEFTDARIPQNTSLLVGADYHFGYGDETKNAFLKIEVPLLSDFISLKLWASFLEFYHVREDIYKARNMKGKLSGCANGDIYVQTRFLVLKEKTYSPNIILNTTLKTASGTNFHERRYFDTPGYFFNAEIGKSLFFKNTLIKELRAVLNLGFLCWETTESIQNDAPLYGFKILLSNKAWKFANTLSGYKGWMGSNPNYDNNYGDAPLIYTSKLSFQQKNLKYFAQYQYGIKDFPYQQTRIGIEISLKSLTPNYKK